MILAAGPSLWALSIIVNEMKTLLSSGDLLYFSLSRSFSFIILVLTQNGCLYFVCPLDNIFQLWFNSEHCLELERPGYTSCLTFFTK